MEFEIGKEYRVNKNAECLKLFRHNGENNFISMGYLKENEIVIFSKDLIQEDGYMLITKNELMTECLGYEEIKEYIGEIKDVSDDIKPNSTENKLDFQNICGRRFKVRYKTYKELVFKIKIEECESYIEGTLENFNPQAEVVLSDDKYGFNIIPYKSIIYMEEIKED
jgi:hypothetical protein